MGTPHADRLYKMESWRTSALEDSHRHLASVSQSLTQIATGNREVAADLGLECATARAACTSLDRLAGRMLTQADALKQIVKSSTDVLNAGIDARNESVEIQAKLKRINKSFENMGYSEQANGGSALPGSGVTAAEIEAKRQAAHAKIDLLAKTSLSKLNDRTLAAIDGLPPHDQVSAGHADRPSGGGRPAATMRQGHTQGRRRGRPRPGERRWTPPSATPDAMPGPTTPWEAAPQAAAALRAVRLAGVPRCKPRTTRRRPPPRSRRRARRARPPAWSGICLLCTTRWHRPRRSREEREWPATRHTKPHARPARCKRPPRAPLSSVRREPHLRPLRPCRHGGSFAARPQLCARQRLRAARPLRCGAVPPGSPAPPRQLLVALLGSFVERPQLCAPRQPRQPLAARPGLFAARLPPCAPRRPRQLRPGSPAGEPRPRAQGLVC